MSIELKAVRFQGELVEIKDFNYFKLIELSPKMIDRPNLKGPRIVEMPFDEKDGYNLIGMYSDGSEHRLGFSSGKPVSAGSMVGLMRDCNRLYMCTGLTGPVYSVISTEAISKEEDKHLLVNRFCKLLASILTEAELREEKAFNEETV